VIAFCGRDWKTGVRFGRPGALVHLLKTFFSLRRYVTHVRVFVADDDDLAVVRGLPFGIDVALVPTAAASERGRAVRPVGASALAGLDVRGFRHVFFTEADQVAFLRDTPGLLRILEGECYAVPHRLERDYKGANRRGQPVVRFDGDDYVVWNAPREGEPLTRLDDGFFIAPTPRVAYGASWLARSERLARADFLAPTPGPLEHACHAMFRAHSAIKTEDISRFFVVHLGGFDNALAEYGLDPAELPFYW
jgi:hypothetical protein